MGELWFVGVGLCDEQDLSRRALARLRECGALYAESYTAVLSPGSLERLSQEIGREIRLLSRVELEAEGVVLEALGVHAKVALLVAGDPFAATRTWLFASPPRRPGIRGRICRTPVSSRRPPVFSVSCTIALDAPSPGRSPLRGSRPVPRSISSAETRPKICIPWFSWIFGRKRVDFSPRARRFGRFANSIRRGERCLDPSRSPSWPGSEVRPPKLGMAPGARSKTSTSAPRCMS